MKNPLKTLEANTIGRDFIIGDLHGSYSVFENLLKNINFDKTVDRIISVGDLVDRGPDSLGCLRLIREPWFHAVLANHEQMMLDKFNGGWSGNYWFQNGGTWGMEAFNDYKAVYTEHTRDAVMNDRSLEIIDLLSSTNELPFLITVNTKSGEKFHVIHAELPHNSGKITDEVLADPTQVLELATTPSGDGEAFLWARSLFNGLYAKNLGDRKEIIRQLAWKKTNVFNNELSHIVSGHTILQKPVTFIGQTNIDTGAYSSYWAPVDPYGPGATAPKPWCALTCIELDAWKFYKTTETTFEEVKPFVVTAKEIEDARARRDSNTV